MSSSGYCWQQCRAAKARAKEYDRYADQLDAVLKTLERSFDDDVRAVNKQLNTCGQQLREGVRELPSISARVRDLQAFEEASPEADHTMSALSSTLSAEIASLRGIQSQAEADAEDWSRQAEEAERQEAAERQAAEERASALRAPSGGKR